MLSSKTFIKMAIIGIGVIIVSLIIVLSLITLRKPANNDEKYASGVDERSGNQYSTTPTGGSEASTIVILGIDNLITEGVSLDNIDNIEGYLIKMLGDKFNKKPGDITTIEKDSIKFIVSEDASQTKYNFKLFLGLKTDQYINVSIVKDIYGLAYDMSIFITDSNNANIASYEDIYYGDLSTSPGQ